MIEPPVFCADRILKIKGVQLVTLYSNYCRKRKLRLQSKKCWLSLWRRCLSSNKQLGIFSRRLFVRFCSFLKTNVQRFVARAYQRVMERYERMLNQKTAVVQSVFNYCYQYRNVTDILELDERLNSKYKMFDTTPQVNTIAGI